MAVIPGSPRNYTGHPTVAALIVEVADTTLFYDTTTKAELYATARVPEYWVLDLDGKQLEVFRDPAQLPAGLGASAYQSHFTLGPTDRVSPLAAPNAAIEVAELLPWASQTHVGSDETPYQVFKTMAAAGRIRV